jgi:uncharacterized protein (UPF0332 family)
MVQGSVKHEAIKLINRGKENLLEMDSLLKNGFYFGAVNRGYYAIFHVISALILYFDGKEFSSHKALISHFGINYAKTQKVPVQFHKILIHAFNIRQRADYDYDAIVTQEQALEIAENAREIVKFVEEKIVINSL